jgi:hypothetical protein
MKKESSGISSSEVLFYLRVQFICSDYSRNVGCITVLIYNSKKHGSVDI